MVELSHDQKPQGWSAGAAGYETAFAPLTNLFVPDAIQLLDPKPADRFLDVCAGTGALAIPVARLGADVTAEDFAPGMVALLRQRMQSAGLSARVEEMDGQALDLPDAYFDVPIAMRLGERGRLKGACESAGLVDVQVHEVTYTWAIDDPAQFFTSLPDWSPPIQPVLAALPPAAIARVRDGFVEAVRDLSRLTGGLETTALLALGRRAST
ncbi:MAG TPA: methyltransferase domain-containing protein [Candidatus Dormibacteraeota bacterium]|nr:methyltransferase domain-containing protein [Candidatus Dormibacteraeota bacterium]